MPRYSPALLAALPLAAAEWEALASQRQGLVLPRGDDLPSDPVSAARRLFGHEHWDVIGQVMASVLTPYSRTAVKGCHASGKTFGAADLIPIALLAGGDVITTAPTDDQVRGQLWRQVMTNLRDSRVPLSSWGHVTQTEIRLPSGERAFGRATNQGVRFQGEHARPGHFLVVMVDEGPGVIADVLGAIEGMRAGGDVRVLLQGNPLVSSGHFYEAFYPADGRATPWATFSISAFDTPNLRGLTIEDVLAMSEAELDENERPYLITRRYVREKYEEWGPDHWEYQARVLAQFPLQADDALLSLAWLEAAANRPAIHDPSQPVQAGVDVAGPGEAETVLCVRQGDAILDMQAFPQSDSRGEVIAALSSWPQLEAVNVDVAGIGHYFAESLSDAGLPVVRINVGEAPTGRSKRETETARAKYANLRAQLFWSFREWASEGMLAGLTDRTTLSQLAGLRYAHDHRGRIAIERKADALKRGVRSPDRAEAVVLAFWSHPRSLLGQALGAAMGRPETTRTATSADTRRHETPPEPRNPHPVAGDAQFQRMLERFGVRVDDA